MIQFEYRYFEFKNISNGMHKWHHLPAKAQGRIGSMRFYSVWFCNMYFTIKWWWKKEWTYIVFPHINTSMNNPHLDTPHIMLKLGTWCTTPGRHQYMLTFNSEASVWIVLPKWMSWQNHWNWIKCTYG